MYEVQLYGLKAGSGSSTAIPIPLNDEGQLKVSEIGVGRTTNPTAVSDGADIRASYDDLGRQIITPYQVRDLISTASAAITTTGYSVLLAGVSGAFLDLIELTGANESTNAVTVTLKDSDGGGTVRTLQIPANDTKSFTFPTPIPQSEASNSWSVQVVDFVNDGTTTNGTVTFSALFVRNI